MIKAISFLTKFAGRKSLQIAKTGLSGVQKTLNGNVDDASKLLFNSTKGHRARGMDREMLMPNKLQTTLKLLNPKTGEPLGIVTVRNNEIGGIFKDSPKPESLGETFDIFSFRGFKGVYTKIEKFNGRIGQVTEKFYLHRGKGLECISKNDYISSLGYAAQQSAYSGKPIESVFSKDIMKAVQKGKL